MKKKIDGKFIVCWIVVTIIIMLILTFLFGVISQKYSEPYTHEEEIINSIIGICLWIISIALGFLLPWFSDSGEEKGDEKD